MLIVHKESLAPCQVRRDQDAEIENALKLGEKVFYPCGIFSTTEMHEAIDFYRSCSRNAIIVSDNAGYEVWCTLPTMKQV
jgi:hypothetical protein